MSWLQTFSEWYEEIGHKLSDLEKIEEQFDPMSIPEKRPHTAELFLGRMQPIHLGHIKIIKKMKNPIVVLVKGKKSSADKDRNPLSAEEQIRLLKKVFPKIRIIVAPTGYLPDIFSDLRENSGTEVVKVYSGADRISGYKRQIDSINKKLPSRRQFDVQFEETPRFTSATKVREAIRSDNEEEFRKLMPKELWDEFEHLQGELTK